jgi:uncharacterized protein
MIREHRQNSLSLDAAKQKVGNSTVKPHGFKETKMLWHPFQTQRAQYIYDTATNEILEVPAAVVRQLAGSTVEGKDVATAVDEGRKAGYFMTGPVAVRCFSEEKIASAMLRLAKEGPAHMILNITERCNLRCRYCSFSGSYEDNRTHGTREMPLDVLEKAVRWYFSFPDRKASSIAFYGGEPLGSLALLSRAVYLARSLSPAPIQFRLTTNGTLFNPEICDFLVHNNFKLMLSLDGPESVHDRYRVFPGGRGSFTLLLEGMRYLQERFPEYYRKSVSYNCVVASPARLLNIRDFVQSLPEFFRGHRLTLTRVNSYPSCLPESLTGKQDERLHTEREVMYQEFRGAVITGQMNPDDLASQMFLNTFADFHQRVMTRMSVPAASHGQCIPGLIKCFVDTTGSLHMCERAGEERPLGNVHNGFDANAIAEFLREYDQFLQEGCSRCWALRLCHKCFVQFRKKDGCSQDRLDEFCEGERNRLDWIIRDYTAIREENNDAFFWCRDLTGK